MTELFQEPVPDPATTTPETPAVPAEGSYERVFHRSDYARFAAAIQRARKVRFTYADPKPDAAQAVIDALAATLVGFFASDLEQAGSPEKDAFSPELFTESTRLLAVGYEDD